MDFSVKTTARIAGSLYLIVIVGGLFAELMVRGKLVVNGDAAATARNIVAHQQLYRWGFAVEIFYCACNIPITLMFYKLFKIVNRDLTMLVVFFSITGTAVEAVSLLAHFAPIVFLGGGHQVSVFTTEQLQAWSYLSLEFFETGFSIALVFFGGYCICMGYMIFRSTFLPRLIGILLAFQGLCYLVLSFSNFLSPPLAHTLFPVLMVSGLGEISFCLWLLIAGVNTGNWHKLSATFNNTIQP